MRGMPTMLTVVFLQQRENGVTHAAPNFQVHQVPWLVARRRPRPRADSTCGVTARTHGTWHKLRELALKPVPVFEKVGCVAFVEHVLRECAQVNTIMPGRECETPDVPP